MSKFSISENLAIYQSADSKLSSEQLLDLIERESREKYPHLHVRFYPDRYMQAKIKIDVAGHSLLDGTPQSLINLLQSQNFLRETFTHHLPQCDGKQDAPQYVLENTELSRVGYKFVMKATFGPSFISFWFRNESDAPRMDLPVFYALEILNRLHHRIAALKPNQIVQWQGSTEQLANSR